jgi:hypothetical protein
MREDGEKLAEIIYVKLLESDNGILNFKDIIQIYDDLNFPLFRKSEAVAWGLLDSKPDVERFKDDKTKTTGLRLKR